MDLYLKTIEFAATFIILLLFAFILRWLDILQKSDAPVFAKLIVNVVLPSLLLSNLARISLDTSVLADTLTFFFVEVLVFGLAFLVGRYALHLPKTSLGVFVLSSTIGSTAILGISYVSFVFDANIEAVAKALLISQIAVGIPAYILCPIVLMWTGDAEPKSYGFWSKALEIFKTPTIIAIFFGIAWSFLEIPTQGILLDSLFTAMDIAGKSLVFLVALLLGLTIERIPIRDYALTILSCALIVLVIEPLALYGLQTLLGLNQFDKQLCYLLSSMPAAYTIIAYSVRYQADVKLASTLVVATKILSIITIPSLMLLLAVSSV
jgi:predicted permease